MLSLVVLHGVVFGEVDGILLFIEGDLGKDFFFNVDVQFIRKTRKVIKTSAISSFTWAISFSELTISFD